MAVAQKSDREHQKKKKKKRRGYLLWDKNLLHQIAVGRMELAQPLCRNDPTPSRIGLGCGSWIGAPAVHVAPVSEHDEARWKTLHVNSLSLSSPPSLPFARVGADIGDLSLLQFSSWCVQALLLLDWSLFPLESQVGWFKIKHILSFLLILLNARAHTHTHTHTQHMHLHRRLAYIWTRKRHFRTNFSNFKRFKRIFGHLALVCWCQNETDGWKLNRRRGLTPPPVFTQIIGSHFAPRWKNTFQKNSTSHFLWVYVSQKLKKRANLTRVSSVSRATISIQLWSQFFPRRRQLLPSLVLPFVI